MMCTPGENHGLVWQGKGKDPGSFWKNDINILTVLLVTVVLSKSEVTLQSETATL